MGDPAPDADDAVWARGRGLALAGSLPAPDDPFFDDPARVTAALRHLDAILTDRQVRRIFFSRHVDPAYRRSYRQ